MVTRTKSIWMVRCSQKATLFSEVMERGSSVDMKTLEPFMRWDLHKAISAPMPA